LFAQERGGKPLREISQRDDLARERMKMDASGKHLAGGIRTTDEASGTWVNNLLTDVGISAFDREELAVFTD
jgi:hypothetical protein